MPNRRTKRRTWAKDPPDGTGYSYWVSSDGFVIETKRRFLPQYGYEVTALARGAVEPGKFRAVRFDTLALAMAAVESWTIEKWMLESDARYQAWLRRFPNPPTTGTAAQAGEPND
jgi:hypothetical protein